MFTTTESKITVTLAENEMSTLIEATEILQRIGYETAEAEANTLVIVDEPTEEVLSVNNKADIGEFDLMIDALCSFFKI